MLSCLFHWFCMNVYWKDYCWLMLLWGCLIYRSEYVLYILILIYSQPILYTNVCMCVILFDKLVSIIENYYSYTGILYWLCSCFKTPWQWPQEWPLLHSWCSAVHPLNDRILSAVSYSCFCNLTSSLSDLSQIYKTSGVNTE
jgi:hypothetical protein